MSTYRTLFTSAILTGLIVVAGHTTAHAHAVCGNRLFPPTLTIDDPGVGDELSLPTVNYTPSGSTGGNPLTQYGFEWDKRITEFIALSVQNDYQRLTDQGVKHQGWDNWNAGVKWQFFCNPEHEFMASVGINRTFGASGTADLFRNGYVSPTSTTNPTLYLGKGLGDLPIGYLRPLALTAVISRNYSDSPSNLTNGWNYGGSIQYSLTYLKEHVKADAVPDFLSRINLVTELNVSQRDGQPTTGTISPGVLYTADTWQFGTEVVLPLNNATRQQQGIGVVAQLHFFLDDIFPTTVGKPIFGGKAE